MVEAHVENLLRRLTGAEKLERDGDGDWPFGLHRAVMYVSVRGDTDPVVAVYAIAVNGVDSDVGMFERLNEMNRDISFSRAFWVNGQVLIAAELVGESLDIEELDMALKRVASAADVFGPQIAEACGGQTPRADGDNQPEPMKVSTGQYL